MPVIFWEVLAEIFLAQGWTPVTNVSGDNLSVIRGTKPVMFTLGEALPFCELAGRVVASRSGLCDLLSSLEEKLTVIYLRQTWNAGTVLTGCGLQRMRLAERTREFEISPNEDIIETLKSIVTI